MALTQVQKRKIVIEALRDHLPWDRRDAAGRLTEDTRTLQDLRREFERRHLGGLVQSYRRTQAEHSLEGLDVADI